MLLTYTEFLDSGLRVSSDISQSEIEFSIKTVEHFYLKKVIGDSNYQNLNNTPQDPTNKILLEGGVIDGKSYAGLKLGECHLVYAYLMTEQQRVTRYSTVNKDSEFSKNTDREDILEQGRLHWNLGVDFINEVAEYYGIDTTHNNKNSLFETILY